MERQVVCGSDLVTAEFPTGTLEAPAGFTTKLPPCDDLETTIGRALDAPLDRPPLASIAEPGMKVTVAFDDPTVPCYAPVWAVALPMIVDRLVASGVNETDISFVCANALHRRFTHEEIARTVGPDFVARHSERIGSHDAEDPDAMEHLGTTASGWDVVLGRSVTGSDLTIYLNCSTMRGFSGGWKSVCVGLSGYRSISHHHTPDIMSMSFDRNRMHEMLDEMGALVEERLGPERIFKIETVLSNPLEVHDVYAGSVAATRRRAMETLRAHQPARRNLLGEPVDIVVYGVPEWSPYAAYSHTNPILDIVSTGLGYLGGVIQALGRPGCTAILATPCPERWNMTHHPTYKEVWDEVLPKTRDPEEIREIYEPQLARRADHIEKYRFGNAFHPVHAAMALYPLKRLRHAARVIVAGARDPAVPAHLGFDAAPSIERAIEMAESSLGKDASIAYVDYPMAINRT